MCFNVEEQYVVLKGNQLVGFTADLCLNETLRHNRTLNGQR